MSEYLKMQNDSRYKLQSRYNPVPRGHKPIAKHHGLLEDQEDDITFNFGLAQRRRDKA
jgi:hypothetical protein